MTRGRLAWLLAAAATVPLVTYALGFASGERLIDLAVYRGGASSVLHGRPLYAYVGTHGLLFTYPPVSALLATPFAAAGPAVADVVWLLATLALLADTTRRLVARALPGARWWLAPVVFAAAAWTEPVRDELRFGQVGVLLLWLVTLDLTRTRRSAGWLTGLAAAIKLTPAVVVPVLWFGGRRRAALVAAGTVAGLTLGAAAVLPRDSWRFWSSAVFDPARVGAAGGNANPGNQALRGMLLRTGWPAGVTGGLLLAGVVVLLAVGVAGGAYALRRGDAVRAVAVAGCLSVAVSPVSWIHAQVWLLPAAVAVLAAPWSRRTRAAALVVAAAAAYPRWPWIAAAHLGSGGAPGLWLPLQDAQGLVVVAAVLVLSAQSLPGRVLRTSRRACGQNGAPAIASPPAAMIPMARSTLVWPRLDQ